MALLKKGKVRDVYDLGYDILQMVANDSYSAFGRHICDVPNKGYYLNKISEWWLKKTFNIISNHYLSTAESSMFVKQCQPFRVKVIVRGYITGSNNNGLWALYTKAREEAGDSFEGMDYYGHHLPSGLVQNQKLATPIVTPTIEKDNPITCDQVVKTGLVPQRDWNFILQKSLELFEYGQVVVAKMGLILVETQYEFGIDSKDYLFLIGDLHTSHYWTITDKATLYNDAIKEWLLKECDPYTTEDLPIIPEEVIKRAENAYKEMYERLVGNKVSVPRQTKTPVSQLAHKYLHSRDSYMVIVITTSGSHRPAMKKLSDCLNTQQVFHRVYIACPRNDPTKVLDILEVYNKNPGIVYITCAGMSDSLSGFVAANTHHPVIAHPIYKNQTDMMVNIHSTLQMPNNVPSMTVLGANNAAQAAARILRR